jgi:Fe2+ transport system protein FeoA
MNVRSVKTYPLFLLFCQWTREQINNMHLAFQKNTNPMYDTHQQPGEHEKETSLIRLGKGDAAIVERLRTDDNKNLQKLLAMGIVPGRIIRVLQTYPVFILQVDRTQAAMDRELASSILVKK